MSAEREPSIAWNTPLRDIKKLINPCSCDACQHGCRMGSGTLADGDAERIAKQLGISVTALREQHLEEIENFNTKRLRPKQLRNGKPYGQCTFFKEGVGCTIHAVKPLECAIAMPCKPYGAKLITWFDVNHFLNPNDPESVRQYAAFLKVGGTLLPGGRIEEIVPDKQLREAILRYEVLQ